MRIKLADLKGYENVMDNLRLDILPEDIFKPIFKDQPGYEEKKAATEGYFFYVEVTEKGPELMIMKNYAQNSKTIAEIEDCPPEHLRRVITNPPAKEIAGMFAIDEELKGWIRSGLGLVD